MLSSIKLHRTPIQQQQFRHFAGQIFFASAKLEQVKQLATLPHCNASAPLILVRSIAPPRPHLLRAAAQVSGSVRYGKYLSCARQ